MKYTHHFYVIVSLHVLFRFSFTMNAADLGPLVEKGKHICTNQNSNSNTEMTEN